MARTAFVTGNGTLATGSAGVSVYACLSDTPLNAWTSNNPDTRNMIVPTPGWFRKMRVRIATAPGTGNSRTFVLQKNGVDTGLSVTISGTATYGLNDGNSVQVAAGDLVRWRHEATTGAVAMSTPASRMAVAFDADAADETIVMGVLDGTLAADNALRYLNPSGRQTSANTTEANRTSAMPTPGTAKKFWVRLATAPGSSRSRSFALSANFTATALQLTISGSSSKVGSDLVNTVGLTKGQQVSIACVASGTPNASQAAYSFVFVPDTPGESLLLGGGGTNSTQSPTSTSWNAPNVAENAPWGSPEGRFPVMSLQGTLKKMFFVGNGGVPGSGKSFTFSVRKNLATPSPTLTAVVTGLASSEGEDMSNEVSLVDDDSFHLQCAPSGTPNGAQYRWGIVYVVDVTPWKNDVTKAARYGIRTRASTTKSLEYRIRLRSDLTKAMAYRVHPVFGLTKGMSYGILTTGSQSKGAEYRIRTTGSSSLPAAYAMRPGTDVQKGMAYMVQDASSLTLAMAYGVRTVHGTTTALEYRISLDASALTKGLEYRVRGPIPTLKGLQYALMGSEQVQKGMAYRVANEGQASKDMRYAVLLAANGTEKALAYRVRPEGKVTKSMAYEVENSRSVLLGISYRISLGPNVQDREMAYRIAPRTDSTRPMRYALHSMHAMEKELRYSVAPNGGAFIKEMRYAVESVRGIERPMAYVMRSNPYCPAESPYEPKDSPYRTLPRGC